MNVKCAGCGQSTSVETSLVDDRTDNYFCDEACFRQWADDNFEEVAEFYRKMNVE